MSFCEQSLGTGEQDMGTELEVSRGKLVILGEQGQGSKCW